MADETRQVRGLPLWLLRLYLEELGGRAGTDGRITGNGWTANLTQLEDYQVGSLGVGQVRLDLQGDPEVLARLRPHLQKKLLRAGG